MSTNKTDLPVMGRCKDCDYTLFSDVHDIRSADTLNDVVAGAAYRMSDHGNYLARCPNRHKVFRLNRIKGTFSEDFNCDSRCLNAKGNECTCSCGGMNHGRGHVGAPLDNVSTVTYVDGETEDVNPQGYLGKRQDEAQADPEPPRKTDVLFAEVGAQIKGRALVTHEQDVSDATLYLFNACIDGEFGTVKWFAPSYANPDFAKGDRMTFKAKVKDHQDNEYGTMTLVTYFEGTVEP